jgi:TrmH family RNA methyltransferase
MSDPPATRVQLAGLADLHRARERRETGCCLLEGERLLNEALDAGLVPRLVAVGPEVSDSARAVVERARAAGSPVVSLARRDASRSSDREHAPALLASLPIPESWRGELPRTGATLLVALCGLQDPGNVGALLRSARAFGAGAALLGSGSADAFGPKVVRASAGAALHLPVARCEIEDLAGLAETHELSLVAAMPPSRAGQPTRSSLPERCLLVLGHETRGVPPLPEAEMVCVPQALGVESLNVAVAGAVLMAGWYGERAL